MKLLLITLALILSSALKSEEVKVNAMYKVYGYELPNEYLLSDVEITLKNHGARGIGAYEVSVTGDGKFVLKSFDKEYESMINSLTVYSMLGDIYKTDFFSWPSTFIDADILLGPDGKIRPTISETQDGIEFGLFLKIKNYRRTVFVTNEAPREVWGLVENLNARISSQVSEANKKIKEDK